MAEGSVHLSLGDLLRGIVREFAAALVMVKRSHPEVRVRSVSLNIGPSPEAETATATATAVPAFLLRDRYPGMEKGWLMRLELGEGSETTPPGILRPLSDPYLPTALGLFGEEPVTAIKGIDSEWSRVFESFGVARVRHLARLDEPTLQELMAASHSLRPREFRRKALLLETPVPSLPETELDSHSLYELLLLSPDDLHHGFGTQRVSRAEVDAVVELLEILTLVIDSRLLQKLSLAQLGSS